MVMKRNAMRANLRQSIFKSLGRYIAIAMIIALGAGIFVGLRMTKADMVATGQKYMDEQNMFDLRLVTDYGWGREQLERIAQLEGVVDAEGQFYVDLIARTDDSDADTVYRFYTMPQKINQVVLLKGRMPEAPNECLADGYHADDSLIGTKITVCDNNSEDSLELLREKTFTVVGYVSNPLYMDMNRGTTSVGNGSLENYFLVPSEAFDADYFTEIHITIPGQHAVYSEAYNDSMEATAERLEPQLLTIADARLAQVVADAEEAYAEGYEAYQDGLQEYYKGYHEAYEELKDAYFKLLDGEQELLDNEKLLLDAREAIEDARDTLQESEVTLANAKKTLADAKAQAYKQLSESTMKMMEEFQKLSDQMQGSESDLIQVNADLVAVNAQIIPLESRLNSVNTQISQTESMISILDISIQSSRTALELAEKNGTADEATLTEMRQELQDLEADKAAYQADLVSRQAEKASIEAELAPLYARRTELEKRQEELQSASDNLTAVIEAAAKGLMEMTAAKMVMDNEFAAAEAQLEGGEAQIKAGYLELEKQEKTIADGFVELEKGRQELADGWKEYKEGAEEARMELADARRELRDGRQELADARETIDGMTEITLHILNRNTNVGYTSLDSASDIVAGVSKVFPAFFLLVSALVCITTMTRMVDEERTQIGTLKALGYSNAAIISKYLLYAGTSAVLGCGLGVLAGSVVFPSILWEAYKIMLFITDQIVLTFNIGLCILVVAMFTTVELLVTWYCCRRSLEEVPAELIRPKAPEAGKQLIFEKMRFWHKVSFLNKVTIRNIFRYKQRLAMMMVGIGGCTALLLTGFGLRDTIVNVVDFQFEEVTTYDISVYFEEGQTAAQQDGFRQETAAIVDDLTFYHQTSVEVDFDNQTREISLIVGDDSITRFIDFHAKDKHIDMPGIGEAVLSVGVAETLGVSVGDEITLRDSDMNTLRVTVSGLYDNFVNNYAIVTPETVEAQWGEKPEQQMAFVEIGESRDVYQIGAEIAELDGVMNITVSDDFAGMVKNMMDALDLVVWVVVFCAGILGAVVLYNLTNININERIREIATIKVLGFNATETAMYVFKENLSLSVMGAAVGLLLGKVLLNFVVSQVKIDFVWFQTRALPLSYVLSVVLTILTAIIVDFVFYFRLEKINMAEALKSVE